MRTSTARPQSPAWQGHDCNPASYNGKVSSFHPLQLLEIFESGQQISVADREEDHTIIDYLSAHAATLTPGLRMVLNTKQPINAQCMQQLQLPAGNGRQAFVEDMAMLATLLADLLDCPQIGMRLEVTSHAMCPKFHVDRTGIRLVCTYLGPGTQWLSEQAVNRVALTQRYASQDAFHAALLRPQAVIEEAAAFAVVLLKGSAWQGNSHAGIVHRSPPALPDSYRVLLALDALW